MSSVISSCVALFRNERIVAKYKLFLKHGGNCSDVGGREKSKEFRMTEEEKSSFVKQYLDNIPIAEIAVKANRARNSIRSVLKSAGVYTESAKKTTVN